MQYKWSQLNLCLRLEPVSTLALSSSLESLLLTVKPKYTHTHTRMYVSICVCMCELSGPLTLAGAQDIYKHVPTLALGLFLHLAQPHQI